jgi:flavin reductase (DIM6/NTAB) family NADH-FMN oxidoreductase RutF
MEDPVAQQVHALVSSLDYPMVVVTTAVDGERSGCLVGFHTQCSIDPSRFIVCISKKNHTFGVAQRAQHLVLHFLDEGDMALASLFGERTGDDVDKFTRCTWHPGPDGVPIVDDCANWAVVRILDTLDGGDHMGFLTEPVDAHAGEGLRQLSFQAAKTLEAGHEA